MNNPCIYIQNPLKIWPISKKSSKSALIDGAVFATTYILFFEISFLKCRTYLLQEKSKIPLFDIFEILWEL